MLSQEDPGNHAAQATDPPDPSASTALTHATRHLRVRPEERRTRATGSLKIWGADDKQLLEWVPQFRTYVEVLREPEVVPLLRGAAAVRARPVSTIYLSRSRIHHKVDT